ncbi:hypothetical protein J7E96_24850 [Streptomyces sp. ISL-96]|nr:hypothetical protein [Streptomyces sp. ISL-96]
MYPIDSFGHERHPFLHRQVRDIASRGEGELTAVVHEEHGKRVTRVAYVKAANGIEWSTAADNIQAVR